MYIWLILFIVVNASWWNIKHYHNKTLMNNVTCHSDYFGYILNENLTDNSIFVAKSVSCEFESCKFDNHNINPRSLMLRDCFARVERDRRSNLALEWIIEIHSEPFSWNDKGIGYRLSYTKDINYFIETLECVYDIEEQYFTIMQDVY